MNAIINILAVSEKNYAVTTTCHWSNTLKVTITPKMFIVVP